MAKNRKSQATALRFGPAVLAFVLCLAIASVGVGYVNQKNQIAALGVRQRALEDRLKDRVLERERLSRALEGLRSTRELVAQVKRMNLGLVATSPDQVVHLIDAPLDPAGRPRDRLYAEQAVRWPGPP